LRGGLLVILGKRGNRASTQRDNYERTNQNVFPPQNFPHPCTTDQFPACRSFVSGLRGLSRTLASVRGQDTRRLPQPGRAQIPRSDPCIQISAIDRLARFGEAHFKRERFSPGAVMGRSGVDTSVHFPRRASFSICARDDRGGGRCAGADILSERRHVTTSGAI
jgi:hypothetical protein